MPRNVVGRWFARVDLRWRLLGGVTLFVLPVLAVQAWTATAERDRYVQDAEEQARSIALVAEANYSQVMLAGEAAISTLLSSPIIHARSGVECDEVLRLFGASHPAFSAFSVSDVDAIVTCSGQAGLVGLSISDRQYFHDALRTGRIVSSGLLVSRPSEIPIIVRASPLTDAEAGVINGVLILSLELDWFADVLGQIDVPAGSMLTVISATGEDLVRVGDRNAPPDDSVQVEQALRRTALGDGLDGYVRVSIPRNEVIAAATTNMWRNVFALTGAASIFGFVAFVLVTTTVQRPINGLVEVTRRMAAGDFDVTVHHRPIDAPEVVELAEAMNVSARSLSEQERRLVEVATVDFLTGLPNRTGFVSLADAQVQSAAKRGKSAAIGVVGLRAFSTINATLGFSVGDEVLRSVASRIQATLGTDATVARLGGDAFIFSLTQERHFDTLGAIAERLHEVLAARLFLDTTTLRVRAYIGLAMSPGDGEDAEVLTRRAELASRRARELVRQWAQFNPDQDEPDGEEVQLLADLQGALERSALEVHYQPKVSLADGQLSGMEALVRWRNRGGYVPPGRFIPLAEKGGMVHEITRSVLSLVLAQMEAWQNQGLQIQVSVNVSALDLVDDTFTDFLAGQMQLVSVQPHLLQLEITETALLREADRGRAAAERLDAMGISLAIDDFGVGFAPLTYLTTFPLHAIKLDRTFVADLADSGHSQTIVGSIIGLAHGLGLEVVAEGVETLEVIDILRGLDCDQAQGFVIARPGPADELASYITGQPLIPLLPVGQTAQPAMEQDGV